MLPVYICEDDYEILCIQKEYIEKQILINGYDMKIVVCSRHPEEIIETATSSTQRGIYFLDIELKDEPMDGFGLGSKIRETDPRGFIIYITAFGELAFETFRYHLEAMDYIIKDDMEKMLDGIKQALETITKRMCMEKGGEQKKFFTFKAMDVIKHIPIDEIMFFETSGRTHRIELHALNDRLDFIGSMQELEEQLGEQFIRVHRGYLVNICHIGELDLKHKEIHMSNGEKCFFSRNAKKLLLSKI